LDEEQLRRGLPRQKLEDQIEHINAAAVFVGENGIGPWQRIEIDTFLRQFVRRGCPVIPVILRSCVEPPELRAFLKGMSWVDFRKREPDPIQQLVGGNRRVI
jgi:hypothetical protein